jgi:hypothetical protein
MKNIIKNWLGIDKLKEDIKDLTDKVVRPTPRGLLYTFSPSWLWGDDNQPDPVSLEERIHLLEKHLNLQLVNENKEVRGYKKINEKRNKKR